MSRQARLTCLRRAPGTAWRSALGGPARDGGVGEGAREGPRCTDAGGGGGGSYSTHSRRRLGRRRSALPAARHGPRPPAYSRPRGPGHPPAAGAACPSTPRARTACPPRAWQRRPQTSGVQTWQCNALTLASGPASVETGARRDRAPAPSGRGTGDSEPTALPASGPHCPSQAGRADWGGPGPRGCRPTQYLYLESPSPSSTEKHCEIISRLSSAYPPLGVYLVPPASPSGQLGVLFGAPLSRKSFLSITGELACATSEGPLPPGTDPSRHQWDLGSGGAGGGPKRSYETPFTSRPRGAWVRPQYLWLQSILYPVHSIKD